MNRAARIPIPSGSDDRLQEILAQGELFRYFSSMPGAKIRECAKTLFSERYYFSAAQIGDTFGFGRSVNRRTATIKAIAEVLERILMTEAFSAELSKIPRWQRTSNGFAVHFNPAMAAKAAIAEAFERHILQISYFRSGWQSFRVVDERSDGDHLFRRLLSNNGCNGFEAGIVIATSKHFPGASFGYYCDQKGNFENGPRWDHAYHESVDKIACLSRWLKHGPPPHISPISRALFDWFSHPFDMNELMRPTPITSRLLDLPEVVTTPFNLTERWGLNFPFFGSFCASPGILPLIVPERIRSDENGAIRSLLNRFEIVRQLPSRSPIL